MSLTVLKAVRLRSIADVGRPAVVAHKDPVTPESATSFPYKESEKIV